ncbi:DUF1127 domain-containing protein [Kumtagia ephedrae]|uniref:DUF1127 domain-containing protein n=1 Tax=Kumtagia ephedrae TaxID=2116701 RepID=A0A2P7SC05_9HYPH|nr:DUF1127 domain-containing protein [Mesorhizobium ephedrae]PSJ60054.1 hypothetical protein C7I84_12210 [Mesorhizobium ephedrae]
MSILDDIGHFGTALRAARRNRRTFREINALPPELQKDIGWPMVNDSPADLGAVNSLWRTMR